jgi:ABC-type dipeptide/oligopeptide/nickel transport system permease component
MMSGASYRLAMAAITLIGVAIIIFVLLRVVPGDPIAMMISPGASPADIATLRAHYGLDASLPVQFFVWAKNLLRGDFGTSISLHRDVLSILAERLPATLELAVAALVFAVLLGGAMAIFAVMVDDSPLSPLIDTLNGLFLAVPDFIWAFVFVLLFGVFAPVLPLSGRIDPSIETNFVTPFYLIESLVTLRFAIFFDVLRHMIMPTLALGIPLAAVITRVLKESLREAMVQDYVLLARIKGMSNLRLILQEALRNAIAPTLALTGVQFTFLIGGTVIVERIFSYPGIGNMAVDAVINRDLPLIQGLTLVFGALFIIVNMVVDLMVMKTNPRLRHG